MHTPIEMKHIIRRNSLQQTIHRVSIGLTTQAPYTGRWSVTLAVQSSLRAAPAHMAYIELGQTFATRQEADVAADQWRPPPGYEDTINWGGLPFKPLP